MIDYRGFIFLIGIMFVALLLMFGLKVIPLSVLAIMAYFLNKDVKKEDNCDDVDMYGCYPDYKSFNRNKDFLDER